MLKKLGIPRRGKKKKKTRNSPKARKGRTGFKGQRALGLDVSTRRSRFAAVSDLKSHDSNRELKILSPTRNPELFQICANEMVGRKPTKKQN